jgi:hypothetical protein
VAESPRWLFLRGRKDDARLALLRSRAADAAERELKEMEEAAAAKQAAAAAGGRETESLMRRKYIVPLVLACVILACNQATGVNSIIGYNATILIQAGLSDAHAHLGYVILTLVNFLVTMIGVALVDRKGRVAGWLSELVFVPVDYNPRAAADEWSGDNGVGASYFSQQAADKLLPAAGIRLPRTMGIPGRFKEVMNLAAKGDARAPDF